MLNGVDLFIDFLFMVVGYEIYSKLFFYAIYLLLTGGLCAGVLIGLLSVVMITCFLARSFFFLFSAASLLTLQINRIQRSKWWKRKSTLSLLCSLSCASLLFSILIYSLISLNLSSSQISKVRFVFAANSLTLSWYWRSLIFCRSFELFCSTWSKSLAM